MNESFLHYVWQYQYFDKTDLVTCAGEPVQVFFPGNRNADAGPDFQQARIRIAGMQWVGSVEIHIDASSWFDHGHENDAGYDNVVLHVVWNNNMLVCRRDGNAMPTLELKNRVDHLLVNRYKSLVNSVSQIPCAESITRVKPIVVLNTLDKMLLTRLETKASIITGHVKKNRGDWEETTYQLLAMNFGFKVNSDPFLQLARALPLKILLKHRDKLLQIESMLFGVAGFLDDDFDDAYYQLLQREYHLLRQKYRLDHKAMNKVQWRFLRLRPANFPTLRLAQFAAFLVKQQTIFSPLLESDTIALQRMFRSVPSDYWDVHYNFAGRSSPKDAIIGSDAVNNIIINTVAPVLAAYAIKTDSPKFMDKAIRLLQEIPPESNKVITQWNTLSVKCNNAFDSQALLEMFNNFCSRHRCLDCNIGASLVKPSRT